MWCVVVVAALVVAGADKPPAKRAETATSAKGAKAARANRPQAPWEAVGVELTDAEREFVARKRKERTKELAERIKKEGLHARKDDRRRWGAERTCIQKTPERWFPELLGGEPLAVGQVGRIEGEEGTTWFCVRVLGPGRVLLRSSVMVAGVEGNRVVSRPGAGPNVIAEMESDGIIATRMVPMDGVWRITGEEEVDGGAAYVAVRADDPGAED